MFWKLIAVSLILIGEAIHAKEPSATIVTCHAAKHVPADEAVGRPHVELTGTVTCIPSGWKGFFISDATGGVYCEPFDSDAESTFWPVSIGEKVALQGVVSEGHLNSFVLVKRIVSRESGPPPPPTIMSLDQVEREVHDAEFISVRGIMVNIINIAGEMEYELVSNGKSCEVSHSSFRIDPKLPNHTEVEISGVVIPPEGVDTFKIVVPTRDSFRVLRTQEQLYADTPLESIESIVANGKAGQFVRFRGEMFRVSDTKTWLKHNGYGIEWVGRLDLEQGTGSSWEFAGLLRRNGDRLSIEHGNPIASTEQVELTNTAIKLDSMANGEYLNRIIRVQGSLIDRNTIDGTTFLTFEDSHGRWSANAYGPTSTDSPVPWMFGATYEVTGLVTSQGGSLKHELVVGDENDIRYVSAPPLSMRHKLAFSIFLTLMLTIGLCISVVSYRHLKKVKNRVETAQRDLRIANESLESKILERTRELQSLNEALTIAERKATEANEAKSAFLANMSHEIRTPMTAILGFTEVLRDRTELSIEDRHAFLNTIHHNGDHLLSVIDDILDLAKIESGKLPLKFEEVNAIEIAQEVVSLLAVKATAKNLALEFFVATDFPSRIWADSTRLRQILLNLVGNAVKFTEKGNVSVKLSIDPTAVDKVRIEVSDSGIGISSDHLTRLFHAFEQIDNSSTRVYGGTGLGLSICKNLVEMLKGEIFVQSQSGVGSCFQLVLPIGMALSREHQMARVDRKAEADARSNKLKDVRVLFAEDGVDNQKLITFHLKRAGAQVQLVENGLQMVEAMCGSSDGEPISPCPFDLIVTDMQMPVMDGYESVKLLRSKGCTLPVVALTAHAMSDDEEKCIQAGCNIYLTKPIDPKAFVASCSSVLHRTETNPTTASS